MTELLLVSTPVIIFCGAFLLLLLSLNKNISVNSFIFISSVILVIVFVIELINLNGIYAYYLYDDLFKKTVLFDTYSSFFSLMLIAGTFMIILISHKTHGEFKYFKGEYFSLLLFSLFAMLMLTHANELMLAFISLEIASFCIYALIGFKKGYEHYESILKYLVSSAFVGSFFLLGMALVYASVGSTHLDDIFIYITSHSFDEMRLLFIALTMLLLLFLFKISAFPFSNWVLDVYKGAPTHITAFMASVFKIAVFSFFLRLFLKNEIILEPYWDNILYFVIVTTIVYGSWLAIIQEKVEVILISSSIVHTGYILMGFISIGQNNGAPYAIMFYLIAYLLTAIVSFGVVSIVAAEAKKYPTLDDFNGLGKKRPYMSGALTVALLSLAGIPSTVGFIGKFYLFTETIAAGYWSLALIGVLATFVSIYYYFKIISRMYFYELPKDNDTEVHLQLGSYVLLFVAFLILLGGIGSVLVYFIPSINIDAIMQIAQMAMKSL